MRRKLSCGLDLLSRSWDSYFVSRPEKLITAAMLLRPHLIMLSAYDPDLPGFEACRRLRGIPMLWATPLVLVMEQRDWEFFDLAAKLHGTTILQAPMGGKYMLEQLQKLVAGG